jgi:hypothetical protein
MHPITSALILAAVVVTGVVTYYTISQETKSTTKELEELVKDAITSGTHDEIATTAITLVAAAAAAAATEATALAVPPPIKPLSKKQKKADAKAEKKAEKDKLILNKAAADKAAAEKAAADKAAADAKAEAEKAAAEKAEKAAAEKEAVVNGVIPYIATIINKIKDSIKDLPAFDSADMKSKINSEKAKATNLKLTSTESNMVDTVYTMANTMVDNMGEFIAAVGNAEKDTTQTATVVIRPILKVMDKFKHLIEETIANLKNIDKKYENDAKTRWTTSNKDLVDTMKNKIRQVKDAKSKEREARLITERMNASKAPKFPSPRMPPPPRKVGGGNKTRKKRRRRRKILTKNNKK